VQVVVPAGGLDEARAFYAGVIGLQELARPETMGGVGAWFRAGPQQLHLSEDDDFAPAARAHPALELDEAGLEALAGRIAAAGATVRWDDRLPGVRRVYSFDPAGNRLEFLARG
jgi:catechol 2,3-dioxygenase-like lactoylglutathione lyase family enzyme